VTLGSGVTGIGSGTFSSCTSLTNFSVNAANSVYSSLNGVLFNKTKTTLIEYPPGRGGSYIIPSSVTSIGDNAFYNCLSLATVTIPNSVTNIAYSKFYYCSSLTNITVAAANSVYSSLNGVLFNKAQTILIQFPPGRGGGYVVPNSVTNIGYEAFYSCGNLASVTIPNNITGIGDYAFDRCTSLTNLTFLGNAPVINGTLFYDVVAGARVYYYYGTPGWGPTYGGVPAVMLGAPAPQIGTGSADVEPGGFGFTLTGVTNQTIVIEASTNLVNWQPIWTSTLSTLSTNFVDPEWVDRPQRFYRARSY
jgi:hypothetical protein